MYLKSQLVLVIKTEGNIKKDIVSYRYKLYYEILKKIKNRVKYVFAFCKYTNISF